MNQESHNKEDLSNIDDEIMHYIRMSFDSNPKKRIEAVNGLAKHSKNPNALYILLELTHDLDHEVRTLAREAIEKAKGEYITTTIKELDEQLFNALKSTKEEEKELIEKIEEFEEELLSSAIEPKEAIDILNELKIKILSADDLSIPAKEADINEEKEVRDYFEGIKNLDIDSFTEEQIAKIDSVTLSMEKKPIYKYLYNYIENANPTQKQLKNEIKRLLKEYERELKFAADLAWYRIKKSERQLSIVQLRVGMRHVNLENLEIVEISETKLKIKRKAMFCNMLKVKEKADKKLVDYVEEGNESKLKSDKKVDENIGFVIVEKHRTEGLKIGDIIDIEKGNVVLHEEKICVLVGKNSKLVIKR
ncbi:MAG: hypothetical protein QW076_02385 [Candidatus Anstonellales archaeon]